MFKQKYLLPLVILCMLITISCKKEQNKVLPIYNPSDFVPEFVDKSLQDVDQYHTIADFSLINQNGDTITQKDYENKIYVADFFFTRCATICPVMTSNMYKIQEEFIEDDDLMLLSLSVTPDIDSVSVLRDYATNKNVNDNKWHVTTGNKKHIYELARKSYFAVSERGDGGFQDFIHTKKFILIDKKKQIRGIYDGTNDDDVKRIIDDIKILIN